MVRTRRTFNEVGLVEGFRSGLEEKLAKELEGHGVPVAFEAFRVPYTKPERIHRYTPDFYLPNGIVIESKGRFITADRQKHLLVQAQHPDLDIRFVFSNPNTRISKTSATTYAMWCEKHGFQYAAKSIPSNWIKESVNKRSLAAILALLKVR